MTKCGAQKGRGLQRTIDERNEETGVAVDWVWPMVVGIQPVIGQSSLDRIISIGNIK